MFGSCHSAKAFWHWAKSLGNKEGATSGASQAGLLIHDANGQLLSGKEKVLARWEEHFAALARAPSPVSAETARDRLASLGSGPRKPTLDEVNEDLTWSEVRASLVTMTNGKAPEDEDGVTAEWLKACIVSRPRRRGGRRKGRRRVQSGHDQPTPMANCIMAILQRAWSEAVIPPSWAQATVVPILKKGDSTECGNYRGISLMSVLLKLLTRIVATRISTALDAAGLLVSEQAGFRTREEAIGQATALFEAVQRRRLARRRTFLAFIDFQKAYDTVPHDALWDKLDAIGVRGRALSFIKQLYANSCMRVRVGSEYTAQFPLQRGVRQGCPLSPILFNIFINDLLQKGSAWAVDIPGVTQEKLAGLLFADDVVLLADSAPKMQLALQSLSKWADMWGMTVGHSKCGVMAVPSSGVKNAAKGSNWLVQGKAIPVVDEYTYLGVSLTIAWDLKEFAKKKVSQARGAVAQMQHLLSCSSIRPDIRTRIMQTLVASKVVYGGELLGMSQSRAAPVQRELTRGYQRSSDVRSRQARQSTLLEDLCISSVYAQWSSQRARAFVKWRDSKAWIGKLCRNAFYKIVRKATVRVSSKKRGSTTWMRVTQMWVAKRVKEKLLPPGILDCAHVETKRLVRDCCSQMINARESSGLEPLYKDGELGKTRKLMRKALRREGKVSVSGFRALRKLRVNGYATAPRMVHWKWLSEEYHDLWCPVCRVRSTPETREHMVVHCKAYAKLRDKYLAPLWKRVFAQRLGSVTDREKLVIALGGRAVGDFTDKDQVQRWLLPVCSFCEGLAAADPVGQAAATPQIVFCTTRPKPNFRQGNNSSHPALRQWIGRGRDHFLGSVELSVSGARVGGFLVVNS